tara:strand:+ start:1431 stop:2432 length:1002 start_codon:yes stop_codon:yes gene_type:complete
VVLIIAEIGINHNGCMDTAKKLIDLSVEAGTDIVKFQTFKSDDLTTDIAPLAEYQLKNSPELINQKILLQKLELNNNDHILLKEYSINAGIEFLSTAFTLQSIDYLAQLGLERWKVPSGEINNIPLLKKIAMHQQPTIISTGMSTLGEIELALKTLYDNNLEKDKITVMHCNTAYPTPMEDVNLKAIQTIKNCFGINVGYSDHTCGIEASIAAVAMGAQVIEKHITLDKNMPGPDHKASINPEELHELVRSIRNVQKALGDGIKRPTSSEIKNIKVARKSLVASKYIKKGETYSEDNLTIKRPGTGLPPTILDLILGTRSNRDYKPNDLIDID